MAWVGAFEDLELGNVGAYRIRLSDNKHRWDCAYPGVELLPGMIISNEPGFYKEGEYGIRIENIIIVQEINGGLLNFENISWAPIDRDLIETDILNENELKWINEYHKSVFKKISHLLTPEEKLWLQKVTMPL